MFYGAPPAIFDKARVLREKMTETEEKLWNELKENKQNNYRFRRQHPIGFYIADFYCHNAKLVIEIDGSIHDLSGNIEYDSIRNKTMTNLGLTVLRFTNNEVMQNIQKVIEEISTRLS